MSGSKLGGGSWALIVASVLAMAWLLGWEGTRGVRLVDAGLAPVADELRWVDLEGRPSELGRHRGSPVVVHVWAGWCAPCRDEVPAFNRLHRELSPRGLVVRAINVDELPAERIEELARRWGIEYPVVVPQEPLRGAFAGEVLPRTWLIDRRGRIRARLAGRLTGEALTRAARKLLSERGAPGGSQTPGPPRPVARPSATSKGGSSS